jgi:hypothetical protein
MGFPEHVGIMQTSQFISWRKLLSFLLIAGGIFYLVDCIFGHKAHPEVSWLKSGVFASGPFGFVGTVIFVAAGFGYGVCLSLKKH